MWYIIDAVDRVAAVSDDWDVQAARNGGTGARRADVVGRPIWSFLEGEALPYFYAHMFETVRQNGWDIELRLRADGPGRETLLNLAISLDGAYDLRVEIDTIRERAVRIHPVWNRTLPRSADLILCCSCCKKLQVGPRWLPVKEAETHRPDLCGPCPPEVMHHICPRCTDYMTSACKAAQA